MLVIAGLTVKRTQLSTVERVSFLFFALIFSVWLLVHYGSFEYIFFVDNIIYFLITLFALIFCLALACFIYFRTSHKIRLYYSLMIVSMGFWRFFDYLSIVTFDLFLMRLDMFLGAFSVGLLFLFSLIYRGTKWSRQLQLFVLFCMFFIVSILLSSLLLLDFIFVDGMSFPTMGPGIVLYVIYIISTLMGAIYHLVRSAFEFQKNRLKQGTFIISILFGISFGGIFFTDLFLVPILSTPDFKIFGTWLLLLMLGIISSVLVQYRFLEVNTRFLLCKKSVVVFFGYVWTLVGALILLFVIWGPVNFLFEVENILFLLFIIFGLPLLIMHRKVSAWIDSVAFNKTFDFSKQFQDALASVDVSDADEVYETMVEQVKEVPGLDVVQVLVLEREHNRVGQVFPKTDTPTRISFREKYVDFFKKTNLVFISKDEITKRDKSLQALLNKFEETDSTGMLVMHGTSGFISGVVLLSSEEGSYYSEEQVRALKELGTQFAPMLYSAILYREAVITAHINI